ncbi:carboxylesterase family domain-containing protein [Phthorimaea operculella]|nr:carboxylesterase family domain-containing protein [Phthorimaea operculella]
MMSRIHLFIYFLVFVFQQHVVKGFSRIDPLVDTKVGLIRGLRASDGAYSMFLGIPFGLVPEDNLFGVSTPYPPFKDVFEAFDDSAICPQIEEINSTLVGTLDCLHLNIYIPNTASTQNRRPVLVWIYGGGFSIGFAGRTLYGPKYIVRNDVILVTINYRLGPYGFMCLDIPEIPGNQGLKDQVLALKWIKNNIESFGGDANEITIMGESAGGFSVGMHLLSENEKMYSRAIMQSGTELIPGLFEKPNNDMPLKLAELLGLSTSNITEALEFLSRTDPHLVIAATKLQNERYLPCAEKEFENVESFITKAPVNLNVPKVKGISVLLGFVAEETFSDHANSESEYYNTYDNFRKYINYDFVFNETDLTDMANIVKHFYIGDEKITTDIKVNLAQFETDFRYIYSTERSIDSYIANGVDKIYYYMFSYVGNRNWVRRKDNITTGGAVHADEIGYLFDVSLWKEEPTAEDQLVLDRMTTMWTNFVKYGDPTPDKTELLPIKWEPITSADSPRYFMNIDSEMVLGKRPYHERMAFWELFYRMNKQHLKGLEVVTECYLFGSKPAAN